MLIRQSFPVDIDEGVNNEYYDEKETQNKDECVIHIYITDNEQKTNRDTLDKVV